MKPAFEPDINVSLAPLRSKLIAHSQRPFARPCINSQSFSGIAGRVVSTGRARTFASAQDESIVRNPRNAGAHGQNLRRAIRAQRDRLDLSLSFRIQSYQRGAQRPAG